jgi:hypothetical protein
VRRAARQIVGLPDGAATALVHNVTSLPTAASTVVRDQVRIWNSFVSFPDTKAAQLFAALTQEPLSTLSMRSATGNWRHLAFRRFAGSITAANERWRIGSILPHAQSADVPTLPYADIPLRAVVEQRRVAYAAVADTILDVNAPAMATLPPLDQGSRKHAAALTFGMRATPDTLGFGRYTPFSIVGPLCSGSLLALATKGRYPFYVAALEGAQCLTRAEFAPVVPRPPSPPLPRGTRAAPRTRPLRAVPTLEAQRMAVLAAHAHPKVDHKGGVQATVRHLRGHARLTWDTMEATVKDAISNCEGCAQRRATRAAASAAYVARAIHPGACVLCDTALPRSVYHLACECTHPAFMALRGPLRATLAPLLTEVVSAARSALAKERKASPPLDDVQAAALSLLAQWQPGQPGPAEDEWRMLSYWALMGHPWPASAIPVNWHTASALGVVFDALVVPPRHLRGLAAAFATITRLSRSAWSNATCAGSLTAPVK